MKKILVLVFLLIFSSVPAWGMTLDEMKSLAGGNMLNEKMSVVVANYGVPALIVDHGVGLGIKKQKVKIGNKSISLTASHWTFAYFGKQNDGYTSAVKAKDPRDWINPNPIMPGNFNGVEQIFFYSFGEKPSLAAHIIYSVYGNFIKHVPANAIYERFGEPDQITQDEDYNDVARYWIVLYGKDNYPYKLYLVDFYLYDEYGDKFVIDYRIQSDLSSDVGQKLDALQEYWKNGPDESLEENQNGTDENTENSSDNENI